MVLKFFKRGTLEVEEDYSTKKITNIELDEIHKKLEANQHFQISGHLSAKIDEDDEDKEKLVNKGVVIFLNDRFVKTVITNENGYFKDYFIPENPGEYKITAYYDGNWRYEKAKSSQSVEISGPNIRKNVEDKSLEKLDEYINLYKEGLLTEDEFKALKEKLIRNL